MHRESVHRARRIVLCTALLVPWASASHAEDSVVLYARAIGDPYPSAPTIDARPPPHAPDRSIPDLPTLGTAPAADNAPAPAPDSESWSWKRILIGVGVVVAIGALASKGGSGSDGGGSGAAPPPSGGGGGGATSPTPAPSPAPPTTGGGGGNDDDDDDDKKKGNKGRRILIPSFSASF